MQSILTKPEGIRQVKKCHAFVDNYFTPIILFFNKKKSACDKILTIDFSLDTSSWLINKLTIIFVHVLYMQAVA